MFSYIFNILKNQAIYPLYPTKPHRIKASNKKKKKKKGMEQKKKFITSSSEILNLGNQCWGN